MLRKIKSMTKLTLHFYLFIYYRCEVLSQEIAGEPVFEIYVIQVSFHLDFFFNCTFKYIFILDIFLLYNFKIEYLWKINKFLYFNHQGKFLILLTDLFLFLQRIRMPISPKCSSCGKKPLEGCQLKRCANCYTVGYCNQ